MEALGPKYYAHDVCLALILIMLIPSYSGVLSQVFLTLMVPSLIATGHEDQGPACVAALLGAPLPKPELLWMARGNLAT